MSGCQDKISLGSQAACHISGPDTPAPRCVVQRGQETAGSNTLFSHQVTSVIVHFPACGIENLKMYFIIGLPDETDDDVRSIASLLRRARETMLEVARGKGRMGRLHAGVSILVPKPYTPYWDRPMLDAAETKRRLRLLRAELKGVPNVKLDVPSHGQALWQGYLSRGGAEAFGAVEEAASGASPSAVMADRRSEVDRATVAPDGDDPAWSFISSAPVPT